MPDLDTQIHLKMLREGKRRRGLRARVRRAVHELFRKDLYGMEWGNPDQRTVLAYIREQFLLPYLGAEVTVLEIGPGAKTIHELSWETVGNALTFDLVRGDLQLLRNDEGDFASATELCVATGLEEASFSYSANPAPGEAWFLLLRPVTAAGPGSYDSSGLEQATGRDQPITGSGVDCP